MAKRSTLEQGESALLEELEPRLLLSADLAPGLSLAAPAAAGEAPARVEHLDEPEAGGRLAAALRREVVFVDTGVDGWESLVRGMGGDGAQGRQLEVILLDAKGDGVGEISAALADRSDLDAIHVVSHGAEGSLQLGRTRLSAESLDRHADAVAGWADALAADADLLFYGCDLAGGEVGRAFVGSLSRLTGADVAASVDLTGSAAVGGDWELEHRAGAVETRVALTAEQRSAYTHVLSTANLGPSADSYIKLGEPANNFGGATELVVDRESTDLQRALLSFDLSGLPAGAVIQSATLELEATSVGGQLNIGVFEVLEGWDPAHVTWTDRDTGTLWTSAGGSFSATAVDSIDTSSAGQHTWDVTSLVQDWHSGARVNHGLMVASPDGGDNRTATYDSSEGATGPILNVDYHVPGTPLQVHNTGSALTRGAVDALSTAELRYDDDTEPATAITYTVTAGPAHGQLELTTTPGVAVTSFTQGDIDSWRLVYVHDGSPTDSDSFGFDVDDGQGNVSTGESFALTISDPNVVTVTTDNDAVNGNISSIAALIASDGGDGISLREAIEAANATGNAPDGPDVIKFAIGSGAVEIAWQSNLPELTDAVVIDGTTQTGYAGTPLIELDGSNGGFLSARLWFRAGSAGSTLRGVSITSNMDAIVLQSDDNTIQGNWIGVNNAGSPEGNFGDGIEIQSSGNTIGGTGAGEGNVIAHAQALFAPTSHGINVISGSGNTIRGNSIFGNDLAIDLGNDGVTANDVGTGDADPGVNTLQNFPVLATAALDALGTTVTVEGSIDSAPGSSFEVDLYWSPIADGSGHGEGQHYLGAVTVMTDGTGVGTFSKAFAAAVPANAVITATATSAAGDTSEFSLALDVNPTAPTLVNNTGSSTLEGGTDPITQLELRYDDLEQPPSSVAYTVTSGPSHGQLELTTAPGSAIGSFTQAQLAAGQVVYVHDGSDTTSDGFDFDVSDGAGQLTTAQSFSFSVTAVDDTPPAEAANTGSTVAEGGTDGITATELAFVDSEQPATSVTYTVTTAPVNGQLELTTLPAVSVSSFTQDDIDAGRLVYVHDGSNTTSDGFDFDVDDGQGNAVSGQSFALTITPVDDDAPTQVANTGSTVSEGGTDAITASELAFSDTEQPATSVTYTVTTAPVNGRLELTTGPGVGISSFTQDDIDAGRLVYVHDGLNTTVDAFTFDVDDGQGNAVIGQIFNLTITEVDDDAPTQVANTGSTIAEGGTDGITASELAFVDTEQPATSITYTVTTAPGNGQLELSTAPGVSVGSFTQDDIDAGRLVYVHDGSNTTSDGFDFDVDDGQGNTVPGQSFSFTITAVDDDAPTQVANTGSTISEGATDPITASELAFSDTEQPATSVTYTVTTAPVNGQLELTTGPGLSVSSFTQDDIDAGRLVYVHDGSNTTSDGFGFDVDDGQGNAVSGQSFAWTITPLDGDPPTLVANAGSTGPEGGTDAITALELAFSDTQQPATSVTYTVTSAPVNGQLELTTGPGLSVSSFTQDDIDAGRLVYVHDGSNTTGDGFGFDVDDGQGNTVSGQSFALTLTPVDDDAPVQVANTGSSVSEGGTDAITASELAFSDTEQPATSVTYTVTTAPVNGQLELTTGPGVGISSFTQDDIDAGRLVYVHDGLNTTLDAFTFDVDDGQGNAVIGQIFNLTITAVDDDAPTAVANTGSSVAEGGTDPLTSAELAFSDTEQPATSVTYTVTTAPVNGQLELTTAPGVSVSSFTQDDIDSGRLVYVHDGSNTTGDGFGFDVDDGQGNAVSGQSFALAITPVDDDAPTLAANTGSTVVEGGTDPLTAAELAFTDTEQPATSVTYTVTTAPVNGQLELTTLPAVSVSSFTQDDIDAGRLVYVHDGSNTTGDGFGFDVDDGQGNAVSGQSFALNITPVDDDAPTLTANTGSTVVEGGTDPLGSAELAFTDTEQPATSVTYTVTTAPANGQLELTTAPGVSVGSFTQDDIDAGRLVYVHDGSNTTGDGFGFDVDDGQGNAVSGQSFALTIAPVDDDAPTLTANTGSTVVEGGTDSLGSAELAFTDTEQPATSVTYTVTTAPVNGQLELTTGPGVAVSSFTQDDIDSGRLVYVHDGSNTTGDGFGFDVDDGQGNAVSGQSFSLAITPVDDDAPVRVQESGPSTSPGETVAISSDHLHYADTEQPAWSVTYTVTSAPAHGQLERSAAPGIAIASFSQQEIDAGQIVYVHAGSNTTSDGFGFDVDDGQGNAVTGRSLSLTITAFGGGDLSPFLDPSEPGPQPEPQPDAPDGSEPDADPPTPEALSALGPPGGEAPHPFEDAGPRKPLAAPRPDAVLDPLALGLESATDPDSPPRRPLAELHSTEWSPGMVAEREQLAQQLDVTTEEIAADAAREEQKRDLIVAATEGATVAASVGLLGSLLRSGSLFAAAVSSLPLWSKVDPLAVLGMSDEERRQREADLRAAEDQEDRKTGRVGNVLDGEEDGEEPVEAAEREDGA